MPCCSPRRTPSRRVTSRPVGDRGRDDLSAAQFIPFFFPGAGEEWKKFGRGTLTRRLAWTNGELVDRQYLMGGGFTVADAYLFTVLRWTGMSGLDLATWPGLTAFQQRVAARPAVQAALRAEGLA